MIGDFASTYDAAMREFVADLIRFETTDGEEAPAQTWLKRELESLGFSTYEWVADPATLASHPEFPEIAELESMRVGDRPNVAGVLEFGEADTGPTLILNGHVDVVPAQDELWSSDPFEPQWDGGTLTARGAVDMKSQVTACIFAAKSLLESGADLDGRLVVESVIGEEEGGIGAAAAALDNPYPFDRDAAIIAEPSDMRVVTATEGCLMKRLTITGRPAHAARKWRGESVLPHFERIHHAFQSLEAERGRRVTHPLYEEFDNPWPIVIGKVTAGNWASNVPGTLTAEMRLGVAPGESLGDVEREFHDRLDSVIQESQWLSGHPPRFERFSVQFSSAEIDANEPIVGALRSAMEQSGLADTAPHGETYGADARHYIGADIPAVVFGPGRIEEAHFPDESIEWADVLLAGEIIAATAERFLT